MSSPEMTRVAGAAACDLEGDSCQPASPVGGFRAGGGLRRIAKTGAHLLYLYGGPCLLRQWARKRRGEQQIVILYYHRIGACDYVSRPADFFQRDLEYLSRHFECLTLAQLCDRLEQATPSPYPVAVVTFDDGYRDNYTLALPLLKRWAIPATFFVSTGYIGTPRVFPHDQRAKERGLAARSDWPKLTWDHLREMQDAGMEIGSHTVEHQNMAQAPLELVRQEAEQSLEDLSRELGARPRAFCFPWGTPADVSDAACQIVRRAGYYAAVTTTCGEVSYRSARYRLPRVDAGNGSFTPLAVAARAQGFGSGRLAQYLLRR